MRPTLFVSDLHLPVGRPALLTAFSAFCNGPARAAEAVYVLGDLFDVWVGDDQLRETVDADVARSLREVAESGVRVGFIRGNRDFLLGAGFAEASGATLLPEQTVFEVQGTPTLILHGDELCTGDTGYQKFRAWARDPLWQRRLLALPYGVRRGIGNVLRGQSRRSSATKPAAMMDVSTDAVEAAFRTHGVARMVHGHTHRPARHRVMVDGRACERWVLADWYDRGSYLECTPAGIVTREIW